MKILSDEEIKQITEGSRQSLFWSKKVAKAQAELTAREIFEKLERYNLNNGLIDNEAIQKIKSSYLEDKG